MPTFLLWCNAQTNSCRKRSSVSCVVTIHWFYVLNEKDIAFSENILSCFIIYSKGDRCEKLREILFFPILHRSHFMLMWYTHEEIILINSLDRDDIWLLERIRKNLVKFLKNLDCYVRSIAVKKNFYFSK